MKIIFSDPANKKQTIKHAFLLLLPQTEDDDSSYFLIGWVMESFNY